MQERRLRHEQPVHLADRIPGEERADERVVGLWLALVDEGVDADQLGEAAATDHPGQFRCEHAAVQVVTFARQPCQPPSIALERQLLSQRGRSSEGSEKPEREEDLSGWLKKFGGSE